GSMTPILIGSTCWAIAGVARRAAVRSTNTEDARIMGSPFRARRSTPAGQAREPSAKGRPNGPYSTGSADHVKRTFAHSRSPTRHSEIFRRMARPVELNEEAAAALAPPDWLSRVFAGHPVSRWCMVLLLGSVLALDVASMRRLTTTYDEPSHLRY